MKLLFIFNLNEKEKSDKENKNISFNIINLILILD